MAAKPHFEVAVEEVHSGDDLVVMVNLGVDGLFKRVRARLYGVDTPNAYRVRNDTDAGKLRDEIKQLTYNAHCSVIVQTQGKGGWLVTLLVHRQGESEPININDMLVERGYVYQRTQEQAA
jgi:hypothetical protein